MKVKIVKIVILKCSKITLVMFTSQVNRYLTEYNLTQIIPITLTRITNTLVIYI